MDDSAKLTDCERCVTDNRLLSHKHGTWQHPIDEDEPALPITTDQAWEYLQGKCVPNLDIERVGKHKVTLVELLAEFANLCRTAPKVTK